MSNDSFVDVDTVRYSVPFRFVRAQLDVLVGDDIVEVFQGAERVAHHPRSSEPHARVRDAAHFAGIFRRESAQRPPEDSPLEALGRSLADYEAAMEVAS